MCFVQICNRVFSLSLLLSQCSHSLHAHAHSVWRTCSRLHALSFPITFPLPLSFPRIFSVSVFICERVKMLWDTIVLWLPEWTELFCDRAILLKPLLYMRPVYATQYIPTPPFCSYYFGHHVVMVMKSQRFAGSMHL